LYVYFAKTLYKQLFALYICNLAFFVYIHADQVNKKINLFQWQL